MSMMRVIMVYNINSMIRMMYMPTATIIKAVLLKHAGPAEFLRYYLPDRDF